MKSKRVWHDGRPPHVGWWNASACRDDDVWRWWDGKRWSIGVSDDDSPFAAGIKAQRRTALGVLWTTYWPRNARVPRVKP